MFSALLTPYIGSGPFYPSNGFEIDQCRSTWWQNALYINNFFKPSKMCFSVSWYLAIDMQLHWFALLMLIPFVFGRYICALVFGGFLLLCNILAILVSLLLNPGAEMGIYGDNTVMFSRWIYFMPWTRMGPFIIGLMIGYILSIQRPFNDASIKMKPYLRIICWIIAISMILLTVCILYPDFQHFPNHFYHRNFHILYESMSRIVWAMALGAMILMCETGNGGIINKFLCLGVWKPLSKLSYSAYLVHWIVILWFYTSQEHSLHVQEINLVKLLF
jgi:peptidoglycan/LPS O-acetylase OafA/YrhL